MSRRVRTSYFAGSAPASAPSPTPLAPGAAPAPAAAPSPLPAAVAEGPTAAAAREARGEEGEEGQPADLVGQSGVPEDLERRSARLAPAWRQLLAGLQRAVRAFKAANNEVFPQGADDSTGDSLTSLFGVSVTLCHPCGLAMGTVDTGIFATQPDLKDLLGR